MVKMEFSTQEWIFMVEGQFGINDTGKQTSWRKHENKKSLERETEYTFIKKAVTCYSCHCLNISKLDIYVEIANPGICISEKSRKNMTLYNWEWVPQNIKHRVRDHQSFSG